jgi:retron-type reverse transcriptase
MSLQTPGAIRTLQRNLYGKAKTEPGFRFYLLYDKVWRADILSHAYDLARANDGAPGVDGVTFDQIAADGLEDWQTRLGAELRAKTYRCQPVRRVMIPKPGGGERPLGIPTIRDRVVQTAAKLVLEPIFEADLDPAAFGYRPKRGACQAIQTVLSLLRQGYTDVVDADLSKYFDTIPHDELMQSIARRIVDSDMLRLIKQWLKAPVETTDGDGRKRMEGGRASRQGVPQGGVISPLIANLYMNRFLKYWRQTGRGEAWKAHVINYADDFVSPADAFRDISPLSRPDPQSRTRGGGAGVDGSHDDPPGADPEPDQDPAVRCTDGPVRLPGLQLWTASHPTGRTPIPRRQSIGQERAAAEGQAGLDPGSWQQGRMARSTRQPDPIVTGVVWLLQPWLSLCRGSTDRNPSV